MSTGYCLLNTQFIVYVVVVYIELLGYFFQGLGNLVWLGHMYQSGCLFLICNLEIYTIYGMTIDMNRSLYTASTWVIYHGKIE